MFKAGEFSFSDVQLTGLSFCHDVTVYPTGRVLHVCEGVTETSGEWVSLGGMQNNKPMCGVKHLLSERTGNVESWIQLEELLNNAFTVDTVYCVACLKQASMRLMSKS